MKLWLARHAQPLAAPGLCYGATDLAADPDATAQAATALADALPAGLACRVSPLARCGQLAGALRALRADLHFSIDTRLAEMDFGCWEGVPWAAIPADAFACWNADFAGYRFGGRESVAELLARVGAALADARAQGRDALWITHAGVARALALLAAGGVPRTPADWPDSALAFGALHCVGFP